MGENSGYSAAVTGGTGRKFSIYGGIDKKYLEMLEAKKDVPLFVSWGRGDFQKGLAIVTTTNANPTTPNVIKNVSENT